MKKESVRKVLHDDDDDKVVSKRRRGASISPDVQNSVIPWPEDLIYELFQRLSWDSLLRFRSVSKGLLGLIDNPLFIKKYLSQLVPTFTVIIEEVNRLYSVDFNYEDKLKSAQEKELDPPFEFDPDHIFCCNGILCLMSKEPERYVLWNPFNNTFYKVKCSNLDKLPRYLYHKDITVGFGYDSSTDDYKIVKLEFSQGRLKVHVYNMRKDTWESEERRYNPGSAIGKNQYGICVDNAIHWLLHCGPHCRCIAFNLETKVFEKISLPSQPYCNREVSRLYDLGGRLCALYNGRRDCIYMVMQEYGVESSWTPLYNINSTENWPIGYFPTWNNRLLCVGSHESTSVSFKWTNPENNSSDIIKVERNRRKLQRKVSYNATRIQEYFCFKSLLRLPSPRLSAQELEEF